MSEIDLKPRNQKAQWWLFPWDAWEEIAIACARPADLGAEPWECRSLFEALSDLQNFGGYEKLWCYAFTRLRAAGYGACLEILRVLEYGARKYSPDNWRNAARSSDPSFRREYFSAICRHALAAKLGQPLDPESGLNHWAHVCCGLLFLQWRDLHANGSAPSRAWVSEEH